MTPEAQQPAQAAAPAWIRTCHWDEADRVSFLGEAFKRIDVRAVRHGQQNTEVQCVIRGRKVKLIGNPAEALRSYLKSRDAEEVWL